MKAIKLKSTSHNSNSTKLIEYLKKVIEKPMESELPYTLPKNNTDSKNYHTTTTQNHINTQDSIKLIKVTLIFASNNQIIKKKNKKELHIQTQTIIYKIFGFKDPSLETTLHNNPKKNFTFTPLQPIISQNYSSEFPDSNYESDLLDPMSDGPVSPSFSDANCECNDPNPMSDGPVSPGFSDANCECNDPNPIKNNQKSKKKKNNSKIQYKFHYSLQISIQSEQLFKDITSAAFNIIKKNTPILLKNKKIALKAILIHPPLQKNSLEKYITQIQGNTLKIQFKTNTFYRENKKTKTLHTHKNNQKNLPTPINILKTIHNRITQPLSHFNIPQITPETLATYIQIDTIHSKKYTSNPILRNQKYWEKNKGFTGTICYKITENPEINRIIKAIFIIAQYYGIGSRPAMGFGQFTIENLQKETR